MKKTSEEIKIPNRKGVSFKIFSDVEFTGEEVMENFPTLQGHGFYQERIYPPGEYLVERFADSYGHQNNKMVFISLARCKSW